MPNFHYHHFLSHDGLKLFCRVHPAGPLSAWLVIVHGHGEHSGRYEKFVERLAPENPTIATYDLRGHGKSEGEPVYVRTFEEHLRDLTAFTEHLKREHGFQGKYHLMGHSMGGLIAAHWALRFPEDIQTLILSSPLVGMRLPWVLVQLNRMLHRWAPHLVYSNPVYPTYLTHNPEELIRYKQDPYIRRRITTQLVYEMLAWTARLRSFKTVRFPFPVYIFLAGKERVVDPNRTWQFYEKVEAPFKNIREFHGFYHEIFNELEQEKAFEALRTCLQEAKKGEARNPS